jgi:hypothetical protein
MSSFNIALLQSGLDFLDYDMGKDFRRALNRIGEHKITCIEYQKVYREHGPHDAIKVISGLLKENQVDIVLFGLEAGYEFPIEYFSELRDLYFMVLYVGDDEHLFDKSSRYYSQAFDLVITWGRPSVERFNFYGVDAIAATPEYDVRSLQNPSYEKVYDACFVGDVETKVGRKEYLRVVESEFDVQIFGRGSPGGVVSRNEMNRLYGSSKIGLNFTGVSTCGALDKDITINRRLKQCTKGRPHEIALTRTFLLTEYAPGIEDNFDIGNEIDIFHDKEELLSKIEYYLKNDAQREEMAARTFKRVIRECDEVDVWKRYLELIRKKLEIKNRKKVSSENIIYKDPIFLRAFSAFHLFKMFEFLSRGILRQAWDEFLVCFKHPFIDVGVFLHFSKELTFRALAKIKWLRSSFRKIKKLARK